MSLKTITIIAPPELNVTVVGQKGTYEGFRILAKDQSGKILTIEKHMNSLKFNKQLQTQIEGLVVGESYMLHEEKNAAGFNEIKSILPQGSAPVLTGNDAKAVSSQPSKNFGTPNQGVRDFESKEERTEKQKYIVRQSSLAQAVTLLPKGKREDIIDLAEYFVDWVLTGKKQTVKEKSPVASVIMDDDLP
jgi:hypothetical protein